MTTAPKLGTIRFDHSPAIRTEDVKKKISIIIPVLNEADTIHRTLGQFSHLDPGVHPHEIIVVDGDETGATINALQGLNVITALAPPGRAIQMNHGAAMATGEVLLFLHADTLLPGDPLGKISAAMDGTPTAWGAFDLGIASSRPVFRLMEIAVRIRTRITRTPYGDQALFLTRNLFDRVEGFPLLPIMEDVAFIRRIHKHKAVMRIIPEKVRTSPRRWETEGLVRCTLRNWLLITTYWLGIPPATLARYYKPPFSRKMS